MSERCVGVFPGVRSHSPLPSVEAAARELKRLEADAVVAVGGGSAIVTARAASILLAEGGNARALCTRQDQSGQLRSPKLLAPKLPQLIVPTTPTAAMVKAGSAVFDPGTMERLALFDPKTRARAVFIHPVLIAETPRELVLKASLNTFAMAVEGLTSRSGDPISDGLLMHAIRLLSRHLPGLSAQTDPSVRGELMMAAVLCGEGTDHTGAGITTALGHAIGARHDLENGIVNAIVLAHTLRFNGDAAETGLRKVGTALALSLPERGSLVAAVVNAVAALLDSLAIPRRLRDIPIPREALPRIAASALGDWLLYGNPRTIEGVADLQQVLEQAW